MDSGDSVRIERLVRRKKGRPGEEIEVLLSDASSFFAAMKVWQQKPFHEGDSFAPEEISSLQQECASVVVLHRAMDLLARAEHSAFLLRQKLLARETSKLVVERVISDLVGRGLLNDARFAASWVRSRVRRHPEGRSALIAGLRQRGVDSSTAEHAVDAVLEADDISVEDLARRLAERAMRARGATPATVTSRLMRRGFPHSIVRRVITELMGSDPGGDQ